jgi:hypothetical protein
MRRNEKIVRNETTRGASRLLGTQGPCVDTLGIVGLEIRSGAPGKSRLNYGSSISATSSVQKFLPQRVFNTSTSNSVTNIARTMTLDLGPLGQQTVSSAALLGVGALTIASIAFTTFRFLLSTFVLPGISVCIDLYYLSLVLTDLALQIW